MKGTVVFVFVVWLVLQFPSLAPAWDLDGFESANWYRGQWYWIFGQAEQCREPIPLPGEHTRDEWRRMLTTESHKLPCSGAWLNETNVKHVYLFLYSHAADSDDPMNQIPETCQ